MEHLIECWARQEEPEQGIEIQEEVNQDQAVAGAGQEVEAVENGEAHEVGVDGQPVAAEEEIRPKVEEGQEEVEERHVAGKEQKKNVIIIGEDRRQEAAIQDERLQDGHLERGDIGYVLKLCVVMRRIVRYSFLFVVKKKKNTGVKTCKIEHLQKGTWLT